MSKLKAKFQCCLLGIGQLFPWNTILTISDYYYEIFPDLFEKFTNYHPARVLALVYQPFVLGTIFTLVTKGKKSKNQRRILAGYCLFVIGTIFLITVDLVSKGKGGLFPFLLLCFIAATFGVANALVEGAMMGDLSCISGDLIQPFAAGLGVAGAITSGLSLFTKAVFQKFSGWPKERRNIILGDIFID
ncbi:Equilibrative nucleotide transporter 3 [Raphanus sativus]|nr:Equilibrative nucleotide transporter 3 [Raphanus sativus]